MSLIGEALNKARQEAARQDAQRQRTPYAVGVADPGARRRGFVPLLAGIGAGCLAAGLLLAVAWSAGWKPFAKPTAPAAQVAQAAPVSRPAPVEPAVEPSAGPPAVAPEQAAPVPIQSPNPAPPDQEPRPQPVLEMRPAVPAETPAAPPAPALPAPAPIAEERPAVVAPTTPAPSAPVRPSPAAGAGDLVDGRTYVGEVPVPGGGAVKLNGIVFTEAQPVAVLDGRVMAPGELIQGFTIAAIESGRVKLQGYGATVFVSPK